jgi:hypothetical protein
MKIRPVGAELLHAEGQTGRYDEATVAFRSFCERACKSIVENKLLGNRYALCVLAQ